MKYKKILSILICPSCKKNIILVNKSILVFRCDVCSFSFKIRNDIFDFLLKPLNSQNLIELERIKRFSRKKTFSFSNLSTYKNFKDNILPLIKKRNSLILEIGGGFISISRIIKKEFPDSTIFVCDISKDRLNKIKYYNKFGKVDFKILASIDALPFKDNSFDYVVGSAILHHTLELSVFVKEIHRVLKKGGYYLGLNEPYGNKFFKFIHERRFNFLNEYLHRIEDFEEAFRGFNFKIKIKIVKKLRYQRPSTNILYPYYLVFKFLPEKIQRKLGGNIIIIAKKK